MVTQPKSPHDHLSSQQQNKDKNPKYQIIKNRCSTNFLYQYQWLSCSDSFQIYLEHKFFQKLKNLIN